MGFPLYGRTAVAKGDEGREIADNRFRSDSSTTGTVNPLQAMSHQAPAQLVSLSQLQPFGSADEALEAVLACLRSFVPFRLWMVTRLDDDDWTVVKSLDEGYGARPGKIFSWSGTYCSRMARGEAPMFAEAAQEVDLYRQAPINGEVPLPIGAYIGLPLYKERGELAGTLCALDPLPQPPLSEQQRLLVSTLARSLSTLLMVHARAEEASRRAERHRYEAETDPLTGLCNRRGWELAVQDQEAATQRMVQNALVMVIDLDDLKMVNDTQGHEAGDELLRRAARVIQQQFRDLDVVARIGGDEFAVLVPGASSRESVKLKDRLRGALAEERVSASVGSALRLSHDSLNQAVAAADAAMYEDKAARKGGGIPSVSPASTV